MYSRIHYFKPQENFKVAQNEILERPLNRQLDDMNLETERDLTFFIG
jgi:hypothetical protein